MLHQADLPSANADLVSFRPKRKMPEQPGGCSGIPDLM
jgi:hypothetical protein